MAIEMGLGIGFRLADGEHICDAATKHFADLQKKGVTRAEIDELRAWLKEALKVVAIPVRESAAELEEAREETKDGIGRFRRAAGLVVHGPNGLDAEMERELHMGVSFPIGDTRLRGYVRSIEKPMKKHSAKLAARGFSKEQQAQLLVAWRRFSELLGMRGSERGKVSAARVERDAMLEKIVARTAYLRRAGRAAFMNSAERADFDRVKRPAKASKKVIVVQQPPAAAPKVAAG